jgi:hypothetical protein
MSEGHMIKNRANQNKNLKWTGGPKKRDIISFVHNLTAAQKDFLKR